ncbi:MAG: S-layer homology domain-containing protein [Candidatus Eremiobacteraeota bacterium]|nr:S-layer homology domain-containing protein [Candidatus Eremiobacteraeota bacterium]
MKKALVLTLVITIFAIIGPVSAAPSTHISYRGQWADKAIKTLYEAGIMEGYPDGTLHGDRALSRWEMAMLLARFFAKMEKTHQQLLNREELDEIMKIARNMKEELSAFGIRTGELEKKIPPLKSRIDELDKVRFYGLIDAIGISQGFNGVVNIGLTSNMATDWFTGRRMISGSGFTALAILGLNARLNENLMGGIEFAAYASQGDSMVDQYWGVTPPFLNNPFTALGSTDPVHPQGSDNEPWTRMNLNRFWLKNSHSNNTLIVGSFVPVYMNNFIVEGPKNPNINKPANLPLFGVQYSGEMNIKRPLKYEFFYSRLPQRSYNTGTTTNPYYQHYNTWNIGGNLTYEFNSGSLSINFMRVVNDTKRGIDTTGSVALPANVTWADARSAGTYRTSVGPQQMNTIGARLIWKINDDFTAYIRAASSAYNPDIDKWLFDKVITGNLFDIDIRGKIKRTDIGIEYLSVEPTYDPFILHYPRNTDIPVFLPYSTYYTDYYQLHNDIRYPNNRQGFRVSLGHPVKNRGNVSIAYEALSQVKPSTQAEITRPGFIEPIFFTPLSGGDEKGKLDNITAVIRYRFKEPDINSTLNLAQYEITRKSPPERPNDNIHLKLNQAILSLNYPLTPLFSVTGGVSWMHYYGHNANQLTQNFSQTVPMIGFSYNPDNRTTIQLTYRLFNYRNGDDTTQNWHGSQGMIEWRTEF